MAHRIHRSKIDDLISRLVYWQRKPLIGPIARLWLYLHGIDIPRGVTLGADLTLIHSTAGVIVHPRTRIGDRVTCFHGVTVGRADPWLPGTDAGATVVLEDDVILSAGAVVLAKDGETVTVGAGTIVGANAVLTRSTGQHEVWAGNPARRVARHPEAQVGSH